MTFSFPKVGYVCFLEWCLSISSGSVCQKAKSSGLKPQRVEEELLPKGLGSILEGCWCKIRDENLQGFGPSGLGR